MSAEIPGGLAGVRVLVTRPRERASSLCFLLEDEGAEVVVLPLLEIHPPVDERPLLAAAEQIHRYRWVAFASPSAVEAFADALRRTGNEGHKTGLSVAVVGDATARAAEKWGFPVTLTAVRATGADLAAELLPRLAPQDMVLLPRAEQGRRELPEALVGSGIPVTEVSAYRSESHPLAASIWEALREAPPQVVLFTSPRGVEAFLEGEDARSVLENAHVVAIGPTTAEVLSARKIAVAAVAHNPSDAGLIEAALRACAGSKLSS